MVAGAFFLRSYELANTLMDLTTLLQERLEGRKCRRCGRRLTDPDSIDEGIGPVCKKHDNHEMVVGWADLRMPRTMHGQRDAKMIAEIGFEHFSNWDIVEIMRVNQANGEWFAFGRSKAFNPDEVILIGMSSYGPITDTFEEEMADGTRIRYECVHTDDEWLAEYSEYRGPSESYGQPWQKISNAYA